MDVDYDSKYIIYWRKYHAFMENTNTLLTLQELPFNKFYPKFYLEMQDTKCLLLQTQRQTPYAKK